MTKNHEMPGQATAGQLQAAALSVRVIYQSASTAPCFVHSVFPLARSSKRCCDASLKVNSSAEEYERTPNSLLPQQVHQIILHRFPLSNNLLLYPHCICFLQQSNMLVRSIQSKLVVRGKTVFNFEPTPTFFTHAQNSVACRP